MALVTATFSNGQKGIIENSKAGYTHAYQVCAIGDNIGAVGYSKSFDNCQRSANAMQSKLKKLWPGKTFVVEIITL